MKSTDANGLLPVGPVLRDPVAISVRSVIIVTSLSAEPSSARQRKRRAGQRARWTLVCAVLCFLGGELLWTMAMAHWRPDLGDPEYGFRREQLLQRLAENRSGRPLLLVLGSSRVAMGVRPDVLADAPEHPLIFNFALLGSGPVMELSCLRRLLGDGIRPAAVVAETWPPFLYEEGGFAEERRLHPNRLMWSDLALLRRHSEQPDELAWAWWNARLLPAYHSRFMFINRWAPSWLPYTNRLDLGWDGLDEWGWLPSPARCPDDESYQARVGLAYEYYAPIFERFQISAVADRATRDLVELCRREGIPITLVLLPESSRFRSWYPPAVRAQSDAYLDCLHREYGVRIIDGRTWAPDEDLLEGFHLLPDGASAFTARLGRELFAVSDNVRRGSQQDE